MPSTNRTFLAVAVPGALDLKLSRLQAQLAGEVPEGRWSVALPFHITLAFLGDVDNTDLNAFCRAAAEAAAPVGRFELKLQGIGAFPNPARPRVVWAGVGGAGLGALGELHATLVAAVARMNYPADTRSAFLPHVTLGRFGFGRKPAHDLTPLVNHYKTWHAGPFSVSEAVVFASAGGRDGPSYAALGRAPLLGRKPGTTP